jgi:hypothetical protein
VSRGKVGDDLLSQTLVEHFTPLVFLLR